MCGCSRRARMSRSRAKRIARSRRRRVSSGSFKATSRRKAPSARSASHTSAMPPRPSSRTNRYGPTRSSAASPTATRCIVARGECRQTPQQLVRFAGQRAPRAIRRTVGASSGWRRLSFSSHAERAPSGRSSASSSSFETVVPRRWREILHLNPSDTRDAPAAAGHASATRAAKRAGTRVPFPTGAAPCASDVAEQCSDLGLAIAGEVAHLDHLRQLADRRSRAQATHR